MAKGPLIILSGPSGCGKSTVIARGLERSPDLPLHLAVSATTRKIRQGERPGVDYFFWTPEQFEKEREAGGFIEWANVYGNYYGTLTREVEPYRQEGKGVILEIDTQGAAQVKRQYPDVVRVLLRTKSMADFEVRLRNRRTESEEDIQRRLRGAQQELDGAVDYEHTIINDNLDKAVAEFRAIIEGLFARGK
jgi:guanylate kinase